MIRYLRDLAKQTGDPDPYLPGVGADSVEGEGHQCDSSTEQTRERCFQHSHTVHFNKQHDCKGRPGPSTRPPEKYDAVILRLGLGLVDDPLGKPIDPANQPLPLPPVLRHLLPYHVPG